MAQTWKDAEKVDDYLQRLDRPSHRPAGEAVLVEALPARVERVLDLGCGDGRMLDLVLRARPDTVEAVGLDSSPPMMARARERFGGDARVSIVEHDLRDRLPASAPFDVVVSGFAIHHLAHERKQGLFAEVASGLAPGGLFANLEVVRCATPELQEQFNHLIGKPEPDPEDVLAPVEDQLAWMRAAGMAHVDCFWRWRGFALLVGHAPGTGSVPARG